MLFLIIVTGQPARGHPVKIFLLGDQALLQRNGFHVVYTTVFMGEGFKV
jgi:hypothetical protein